MTLSSDASVNAVEAITFENTYTTTGTSVSLGASKVLNGRAAAEGEFEFALTDAEGKVLQTVGNAADGSISFEAISYDEAGTYEYTISEVMPEDDDPNTEGVQSAGITYDQTVYNVKVTVEDNGIGSLVVAGVTYNDGTAAPVFTNTYAASEPGSIIFGATKVLEGRDLVAGEFTFELVDQDGNVVARATNGANGVIVFTDPVAFSAAGTYTYTVREVLPEDDDPETEGVQKDGVTYDETVWTATVTVTDNLEGGFTATVAYNNGAELPVFTNTYVAPEVPAAPEPEPAPEIPDTGDHTSDALPAVLAVGGVTIAASAVALAKRRNQ